MKLILASLFTLLLSSAILAQAPAGYYAGTDTMSCANLKTTLKKIISTSVKPGTYGGLWTQYALTDIKPRTVGTGSANVIYDIYSTVPNGTDPYQFTPVTGQCGNYSGEGGCYNREHSVPLSWFGGNTSTNGPATDYNFIFPTDGKVNAEHANYPYAEVAVASWTSKNGTKLGSSAVAGVTGQVFEPIDEFKGDIARAFLYFVTMYEDNIPTWASNADASQSFDTTTFPSVKLPYLQMMLKWNDQDPVSQKEIDRNNGAYSHQNNRNPFIDSPQYVHRIWGIECPGLSILPVNLVYFTAKQSGSNVLLRWQVSNELNLVGYDVQRSNNGSDFVTIANIKAGGGSNYSYTDVTDANSGNVVYYRLKKVDKTTVGNYSEVVKITLPVNEPISVYPNPARDNINIVLTKFSSSPMSVSICDATGRLILHANYTSANNAIHIPTYNFANGNYYLRINVGNESYLQKIIIAK